MSALLQTGPVVVDVFGRVNSVPHPRTLSLIFCTYVAASSPVDATCNVEMLVSLACRAASPKPDFIWLAHQNASPPRDSVGDTL